jgi:hypothetical protein
MVNLLLFSVYLKYIDSVMNPSEEKNSNEKKTIKSMVTCIDEYREFGFGRSLGGK